jgi:hypothetical protein
MTMAPEICPNCGAEVPRKAKACPECGSSEETGWSEDAYATGLELPDDTFDYNEYLKREFNQADPLKKQFKWYYLVAAAVVIFGLTMWIWRWR